MDWYQIIMAAAAFLISILLGVIGFFLKKQITAIEKLEQSVQTLYLSTELVKTNFNNSQVNCLNRHELINESLQGHEKRIRDNEIHIAVIQKKSG